MAKVDVITCDGNGCGKTLSPGQGFKIKINSYQIPNTAWLATRKPKQRIPKERTIEKDLCPDCTEELMGVN